MLYQNECELPVDASRVTCCMVYMVSLSPSEPELDSMR